MAGWLEALTAPDLGLKIAGNNFRAVQTVDEEFRREVRFNGALGSTGSVVRAVRNADEQTISTSMILLDPTEDESWQNGRSLPEFLKALGASTSLAVRRGGQRWVVYNGATWTSIRVSTGLEQVLMTADFSVPGIRTKIKGAGV